MSGVWGAEVVVWGMGEYSKGKEGRAGNMHHDRGSSGERVCWDVQGPEEREEGGSGGAGGARAVFAGLQSPERRTRQGRLVG